MKKDINKIPSGDYCYDENGVCPYWDIDETKHEQENGVCHFLDITDYDDNRKTDKTLTNMKTGEKISPIEAPINVGLLWDQVKACGINNEWDEDDLPPLTEEQMAEIDKRIEDLDRWEKEGTLDEHTISHEELMKKIEKKYKIKGEEK